MENKMSSSKFIRRHWHDIGLLSATLAGIYLIFAWNEIVFLQKLLILNFIAVLLHQFEEYSWPGGFPAVGNIAMLPSEKPDRYPLNQNSAMVANLLFAYVFFLIPVFFPGSIWLGLAPILVGSIIQFISHGIYTNIKLKYFYNPGLAATAFGHIPIAIFYIRHIITNNLVNQWDWIWAVVYMFTFLILNFYIIEQKLLSDKNSPYPFDPDEMKRFNVGKKLEHAKR